MQISTDELLELVGAAEIRGEDRSRRQTMSLVEKASRAAGLLELALDNPADFRTEAWEVDAKTFIREMK